VKARRRRTPPRSIFKRALYSFLVVLTVLVVGTLGLQSIEGTRLIDAFYFMSMLATAQGPPTAPSTDLGKIFASIMAFISVGTVVAALGFIFGPFFGTLWRMGVEDVKREIRTVEDEIEGRKKERD